MCTKTLIASIFSAVVLLWWSWQPGSTDLESANPFECSLKVEYCIEECRFRADDTYVFLGVVKYVLSNESEKVWKLSLPVLRMEEYSEARRSFIRHDLIDGDLKAQREPQIAPGEKLEFTREFGRIQIGKRFTSRHVLVFGSGDGNPDEYITGSIVSEPVVLLAE